MDSKANLENLQRSGGLKAEPPDRKECDGLMRSARDRLRDAGKVQVRLLALCHERRNLAEYEGYMDEDEPLLAQLIDSTTTLRGNVEGLLAGYQWA
ncbi:hypothetical protein cym2001_58220 [Pseudomonas sp. CYM-20-01]|uniref:hypothetical protein n=1 Tax=Pseudomonas sp. CYM-20-01 TaxID=2870750 RepID=UPI002058B517|nr:hypothetical protein [Pseudomonas sp. CYM-20-01]BDB22457.1 hypothetical protein cym2001_58220 [Pseudomonas sp. CYM-20-01]